MKLSRYLVVKRSPQGKAGARLTTNPPALDSNEITVKLDLDIPDKLFAKPQLQANITIDKEAITAPTINAEVIDNIQEVISQNLGVDLNISLIDSTGE